MVMVKVKLILGEGGQAYNGGGKPILREGGGACRPNQKWGRVHYQKIYP